MRYFVTNRNDLVGEDRTRHGLYYKKTRKLPDGMPFGIIDRKNNSDVCFCLSEKQARIVAF
jgi:hypothetical protein